jgi:hypothetical protein
LAINLKVNIFELKIWDDECKLCTFYTVQNDGDDYSETDKFLYRYEQLPEHEENLQSLLSFILKSIGDDHGAIDELFNRPENEVTGLPVQGRIKLGEFRYHYPNFPLRIYALKITEEIVVLFNGGIKDGPTNQTSSLHIKWIEACAFARRIMDALYNNEIVIDYENRELKNKNQETEIIL